MLKKLKIRIVAVIMTIVTVLLCITFSSSYFSTKTRLYNESIEMMMRVSSAQFKPDKPGKFKNEVNLPYFIVRLNSEGEIVGAESFFYEVSDNDFLYDTVDRALMCKEETGELKDINLRFFVQENIMGKNIVFADTYGEAKLLSNLKTNFFLAGTVAFFIFLVISIILAGWLVKPTEKVWNQQKQFIADASHELKTPLTVIMANAELLSLPDNSEYEKKKYLNSITLMSQSMKKLVEQMLILARTEDSGMKDTYTAVDFSKICMDSAISFEGVFAERGMELLNDVEKNIRVFGNGDSLKQVVEILLDNAQKYGDSGSTAYLSLFMKDKSTCCLKVSSKGEKLSSEDVDAIFRRFYRKDESRSQNGSFGLGLAIADNILNRHGGKIWAESNDNTNDFILTLPVIK